MYVIVVWAEQSGRKSRDQFQECCEGFWLQSILIGINKWYIYG